MVCHTPITKTSAFAHLVVTVSVLVILFFEGIDIKYQPYHCDYSSMR